MAEILTEEKVKQIIDKYIQEKIKIEIDKLKSAQEISSEKLTIIERIVRVEEELKAQRELMRTKFEQFDKRFEDIISFTDKRIKLISQIIFAFNIPILIGVIGLLIKSFLP